LKAIVEITNRRGFAIRITLLTKLDIIGASIVRQYFLPFFKCVVCTWLRLHKSYLPLFRRLSPAQAFEHNHALY
jgi:hypothetical protein